MVYNNQRRQKGLGVCSSRIAIDVIIRGAQLVLLGFPSVGIMPRYLCQFPNFLKQDRDTLLENSLDTI